MATNLQNSKWLLLATLSLAAVAGCCCQAIPLPAENQCPTDARRMYLSCGEEAVRRCPCGPDRDFYGLKPTCWREWPEGWHCNGYDGIPCASNQSCGDSVVEETVPVVEAPSAETPAATELDHSNPFRSKPGAAELPLPPKTPEVAPPQNAPQKQTPIRLTPSEPAPTVPPALEKIPNEPAPIRTKPAEPPTVKNTSAEEKLPSTQIDEPVATPITSQPPAASPQLNAPENAPKPSALPAPSKQTLFTKPVIPKPPVKQAAPVATKPDAKRIKSESVPAEKSRPESPAMSNRVEEHVFKNLRL